MPSTDAGTVTPGGPTPAGAAFWKRHPIDIRFSLPFFGGWFYVTVVSGPERRNAERRERERHHYPLRTVANIFFIAGTAAGFYAVALVILAFASSIIEW